MYRRSLVALLLSGVFVALVTDAAYGQRFRRRSRSYNNYSYGSSGSVQLAPKSDATAAEYRDLRVYCDYDLAKADEVAHADRVSVFLNLWDEEVLAQADRLVAEVKITDVGAAGTSHVRYVPVSVTEVADEEYRLGTFELSNMLEEEPLIRPARIYRLFINLHTESAEYDQRSALGRLPGPYYVATSGELPLEKARQRIVMRTFREWYYTERGWNRSAEYPMDCHAYYRWAAGCVTVGSTNGWANIGRLFNGNNAYHNSGHLVSLMRDGPIHGDYVRKPGHTFMLLAYDLEQGQVWTMEANFNHTIEIVIRTTGSDWSVGHLRDDHIQEGLFETADADQDLPRDMTARREASGEEAVVQ